MQGWLGREGVKQRITLHTYIHYSGRFLHSVNSEIFARFFFANSVNIYISDILNSRLKHDLPISVNDRVILPFCEDFTFAKHMRSFAKNKT